MSDGLGCFSPRDGTMVYNNSPVAACEAAHLGQSYGFHLVSDDTYWLHRDSRSHVADKCLTIDLRDIFYGTTKYTEIESNAVDGKLLHQYFVPIHQGCESGTHIIFSADDREYSAAAIFTICDEFKDDESISVFRHGADVYMRFVISVRMALCGFKLLVNAIDGRLLQLLITDVISPDYVKIIPNEGLPKRENTSAKGDLHLCFKIEFPKTLSRHSKEDIADALDRAQP